MNEVFMVLQRQILNLIPIAFFDFLKKENPTYETALHIREAVKWLCAAQDSNDNDGGVSEGFHLLYGWLPSYPETTGYIIETFLEYSRVNADKSIRDRALKMADWLISIQNDDGSIPDSYFQKRLVFDSGQVIFGFIQAYEETKKEEYREAAVKTGKWLCSVQEKDGSWIKFAFNEIPHTYYTRVAWSLAKLHSITKEHGFLSACINNIHWAISQQEENGWFNCASFRLKNHVRPYTHTIAYTIRGILETGLYLDEKTFIRSAVKAIDNLIKNIPEDGGVFGSYNKRWKGIDRFSCLTGNAQLAIILFKLFTVKKDDKYLIAAKTINDYLKRKQELRIKNINIYGALAGSFPIWGKYIHYTYPNWASKFFIDSLLIETALQ